MTDICKKLNNLWLIDPILGIKELYALTLSSLLLVTHSS